MHSVNFCTKIFTSEWSRSDSEAVLDVLLDALVKIDELYLRHHPNTPHPYRSGVRYYHDGTREEWLSIPECLHETIADCKSLAPWLVAYYHVSGIDRGAKVIKRYALIPAPGIAKQTILLYHILVQRSDGTVEDPSRELGMGGEEPDGYIPLPGVPHEVLSKITEVVGAALLETERDETDGPALKQLRFIAGLAQRGDGRAIYLINVARAVREAGYDPRRTEWARLPDGRWSWVTPAQAVDAVQLDKDR